MSKYRVVLVVALMLVASSAYATQPFEEYSKHVESAQGLSAASDSLMGDSVSLYNGATEFTATDISIPGNNALPVQLSRRFALEVQTGLGSSTYGGIGNWDIDVPYISASWVQGSWPSNRCTQLLTPSVPAPLSLNDVWHFPSVHFPGAGDRKLLSLPAYATMPIPRPTTGTYSWATASRDVVSCTTTMSGALSGDGFLLQTTDGVKYYFDVATTRILEGIQYQINGVQTNAGRTQYYILASKIEDRFGNTVTFTYNANGYPKTITSSDGRKISLFYDPSGMRLDHASVNSGAAMRTWSYTYGTAGDDTGELTAVTLPDSSKWHFAHAGTLVPLSQLWDGNTGANCQGKPPVDSANFTFTVRHPGGAQGEFVLGLFRHPRSGVHINSCNPINQAQGLYKLTRPNFLDSMTLVSKTITGPGLAPREWTYDFPYTPQPLWGTRGGGAPFPCPITTCDPDKIVTVNEPDGTKTEYTYGYLYGLNEGRLLETKTYDSAGVVQRDETTTYVDETAAASQNFYRVYGLGGDDEPSSLNVRPVVSRTITQDGETYTWSIPKGCTTSTLYCVDIYGNPTKVVRSSTLGYTRTEQTTFVADTDALVKTYWLLGLATQTKCVAPTTALPAGCGASGTIMSETTYLAQYGLPLTAKSFGKLQQTLAYTLTAGNQDGTLSTVKDGNNHTTTLSNWYRGVPTAIAYADGESMSALVDDNGWITSVTNESGYPTGYSYDAAGRVNAIAYPTGDTPAWNPTTVVYEQSDGTNFGVEYGIPIGHWRRTESTGNSRSITYFDGMWRPIVKQQYDSTDATNTRSISVSRYNTSGLQSFASYPLAALTDWADAALTGTKMTYDALNRIRTSTQDSELGPLTTSTLYVDGADGPYTQITNPRGNVTRMSYQAYDQPSSDAPVWISGANGNIVTTIARDPFSKPVSITRSNASGTVSATRSYVYNSNQELCKSEEPETFVTLMGYDAAGNLSWSAAGLPTSTVCDPTGNTPSVVARKAARTYDARNRLLTLSFPDGRGDQTWNYTPDGLPEWVHTFNASNPSAPQEVINHYTYNRRRLLVGESSDPGTNPALSIGYGYNANGHLTSQVWPDGATAQFNPNALGQAERVDTGASTPHAWNAKYFPNGALKSFAYGNGILHEMQQNDRKLPESSKDSYSGTNFIYDNYEYDPDGNVAAILDGATGTAGKGDRTMEYDEADRLTSATSPMFGNGAEGTAQFGYDALDNLTRVLMPGTASARNWFYCYDEHWRLTNVKVVGCDGGSTRHGMGYDDQGNVDNKDGVLFDFDFGNRLRRAGPSLNPTETYQYDAYGRRVVSIASSGTIQSVYSQGGQLLYQNNARTGKRINYYYLAGSLVNEVETTVSSGAVANRFQHTDSLGSPVLVTDGSRVPVGVRNEYEPYGQVLAGGIDDRPGYAGQVADALTSMDYMQQRYYDPLIGRFLSTDPVSASSVGGNFNRYLYANDNPFLFTDPDGRTSEKPKLPWIGKDWNSLGAYGSNTGFISSGSTVDSTKSDDVVATNAPTNAPKTQIPSPDDVPGGPWKEHPNGNRPGQFLGPDQPNGGKPLLQYVPPEGEGGPPGSKGYWKVNLPGEKGWQRYNLGGVPKTPEQVHPMPRSAIPIPSWLGPVVAPLICLTCSLMHLPNENPYVDQVN